MKKFLIVLSVLLAVCIGIFFIIVKGLDVENYKKQVVASIQELTGRQVTINGSLSLQWQPSPTITIQDVSIANLPGTKYKQMINVKRINAVVEWDSLFKNPLVFKSIILEKPVVRLERYTERKNNWDFAFLTKTNELSDNSTYQTSSPFNSPKFENTQIIDGTVIYADFQKKKETVLQNINGTLVADSVVGPFKFDGRVVFDKKAFNLLLASDRISRVRATEINLQATSSKDDVVAKFKGFVDTFDNSLNINGSVSLKVDKFSSFMKTYFKNDQMPDFLNSSLIGNMNVDLSHDTFALTDIAYRYGDNDNVNAFTGELSYLLKTGKNNKSVKNWKGKFLMDALDLPELADWAKEHIQSDQLSFLKSADNDFDFIFKIKKLKYNDKIVDNVNLNMSINQEGTRISHFSLKAPYNTLLTAKGNVFFKKDQPTLDVQVDFLSDNLQSLSEWIKYPVKLPKAIKNAKLKGEFSVDKTQFSFLKTKADFDNTTFEGNVKVLKTEPPVLIAMVSANNWNMDNYFTTVKSEGKTTLFTIPQRFADILKQQPFLKKYRISAELGLKDIKINELPVSYLQTMFKSTKDFFHIQTLDVRDMMSLSFKGNGRFDFPKTGGAVMTNVNVSGELLNADLFFGKMPDFVLPIQKKDSLNGMIFKAELNGNVSQYSLYGETEFDKATISYDGLLSQKDYQGSVTLAHPSFHSFVRLFKKDFNILNNLTGTLQFAGDIKKEDDLFEIKDLSLQIGNQNLEGNLSFDKKTLAGQITSPLLDIDKFLTLPDLFKDGKLSTDKLNLKAFTNSALDLDLFGQFLLIRSKRFEQASFKLTSDKNDIKVTDFKALYNKGVFRSDLHYNIQNKSFDGMLELQNFEINAPTEKIGPFQIDNGTLTITSKVKGIGDTPVSIASSLSGEGTIALIRPTIRGISLENIEKQLKLISERPESLNAKKMEEDLKANLSLGLSSLNSIKGDFKIQDGIINAKELFFYAKEAQGTLSGKYNLPKQEIDAKGSFKMDYLKNIPTITLYLKGPLDKAVYTQDDKAFKEQTGSMIQSAQKTVERKEKAHQQKVKNDKNQERKEKVRTMSSEIAERLAQSKAVVAKAPKSDASLALDDLNDLYYLLQEISVKEFVSVKDFTKAEKFYQQALQKQNDVNVLSLKKTLELGQEALDKLDEEKTEPMENIDMVHDAFPNAQKIETAWQKATEASALMEQNRIRMRDVTDISEMEQMLEDSKQALKTIHEVKKSFERFDLSAYKQKISKKKKVRGTIKRN